jgi:transcriptional regulator with XRE-family HTH domain
MNIIGKKVQEHREKNGLSQEMLSEKLGVSRQSVSKWELGQALPEVDKIVAMSRLFGVTTDELLLEVDYSMLTNIKNFFNENPNIIFQVIRNILKRDESEKQKLAIVMVSLGADYAAKIYKHLTDDEIAIITMRVRMLSSISESTKNEVLDNFYKRCIDQLAFGIS